MRRNFTDLMELAQLGGALALGSGPVPAPVAATMELVRRYDEADEQGRRALFLGALSQMLERHEVDEDGEDLPDPVQTRQGRRDVE